jgi:hypothetical protein
MRKALILALYLFLAARAVADGVTVRVPEGVNLPAGKVRARLAGIAPNPRRYDALEIVVYYYSMGAETFSYSDTDTISESTGRGGIKALIKCKKNNTLQKALFVEASGADEDQILENFRRAVAEALRGL